MIRVVCEVRRAEAQAIEVKEQIAMDLERYGTVRVERIDEVLPWLLRLEIEVGCAALPKDGEAQIRQLLEVYPDVRVVRVEQMDPRQVQLRALLEHGITPAGEQMTIGAAFGARA